MFERNQVVCVIMITYNHDKFIEKAIESVLMQKTNFAYEFIIEDDNSFDNTKQLCLKYQEKYPSVIKFKFNEKNIGFQSNFIKNFKDAKCKYAVYIEGDDYWIDENKLQKQFDLMEAHPEVAFCYTNAYSFFDGNEEQREILIKNKPGQNIFDLDYYLKNDCFAMPTLTTFARKDAFPDPVPEWLYTTFKLDWALDILYLQKGKAAYLDEITAMYRVHKGGVTSSTSVPKIVHSGIELIKNLDKHFNFKYHRFFGNNLWHYQQLSIYYFQKRFLFKGFYYFLRGFLQKPLKVLKDTYYLKTIYKVLFQGFKVFD